MSAEQAAAGQEGAVAATDPAPAQCKNCGATLGGRFCTNCGQPANVHVPTTMELLHELMEGLSHSDSRLWRTLFTLWTKPGRLTQEFVAGRRVAYLPPFRLFLVLSVAFFLLASLAPVGGMPIQFDRPAGPAAPSSETCDIKFEGSSRAIDLNARARHICEEIMRDNGTNLQHIALATMSKAMIIFLPLIAFLNALLYWRPRYRYPEHLLFFAHLHAFYFSAGSLALVGVIVAHYSPALQGAADGLRTVLGWAAVLYTVVAVRRVFARSWKGALGKSAALAVAYLLVFSLTVAGVYLYAILQL